MIFTPEERADLREATYAADAKVRADALKLWSHVVAYVEGESKDDPPYHYMTRLNSLKGFVITRHDVPVLYNLAVVLAPGHGVADGAFTWARNGTPLIVVHGALKGPFDTTDLAERLRHGVAYRKVFVHEFAHYQDSLRNPALRQHGAAAARAVKAGQRAAYFRTPEEFNAWFQGTSQEIEDALDRELEHIRNMATRRGGRDKDFAETILGHLRHHFQTFHNFQTWIETLSFETPDLMQHFKGTKWERKWLKRLHTLYTHLKPKADTALKEGIMKTLFTEEKRQELRESAVSGPRRHLRRDALAKGKTPWEKALFAVLNKHPEAKRATGSRGWMDAKRKVVYGGDTPPLDAKGKEMRGLKACVLYSVQQKGRGFPVVMVRKGTQMWKLGKGSTFKGYTDTPMWKVGEKVT